MPSTFVAVAPRSAWRCWAMLACAACSHIALTAPAAQGEDASSPALDAASKPAPDSGSDPGMLNLAGDISPVHDPAIIATPSRFYIFSTGEGLPIHQSTDLVHWTLAGQVFATKPAWITTTNAADPNILWAPDVSYFGGLYHLYYAASSFGSQSSCIGHATTASLETPVWQDRGSVICSTQADDWNAIDPAPVIDQAGAVWLALGSFWTGLKLIQIDANGNRLGTEITSLATRANTAVEAAYIIHHGDFYYLFESVDRCCQGVNSTYKIMAGRSPDIKGPYVDADGIPLLSTSPNGGDLIVTSGARWKGPGHNAVLKTVTGDYNIYHAYDGEAAGVPTLRIAKLQWSDDGWPRSSGP